MTLRKKKVWDCVIVGAGPAGLSAAVYMGRFRRSTLVLDSQDGRWSYGQVNDNYLGFPGGVRARRLHALGRAQAERFGVTFQDALVTGIAEQAGGYRIEYRGGEAEARTVIWAAGVRDRWPAFPGVRRLVGKHLFWCIVCDGWRTLGRSVLLLGNTEKAVGTALQFLTYTRDLTFVMDPGPKLNARCRQKLGSAGIPVRCGQVKRVQASDTGTRWRPRSTRARRRRWGRTMCSTRRISASDQAKKRPWSTRRMVAALSALDSGASSRAVSGSTISRANRMTAT